MPEYRCKVYLTEIYEAEIVVKAENNDGIEAAVAAALEKDKGHIEWELHDDSFEVIEASEA